MKWPLKYRFWRFLHKYANILAWKFATPPGPEWGQALRINHKNLWWRLNDWVADHYTDWYVHEGVKLMYKDIEK